MKRRNGRRLFLGFQWNASSWERAPVWLEVLGRRLDGLSVHWNLPAFPPEMPARRRSTIAKSLQSRLETGGDIVTSLGFAGACHPLLSLDELEREIAWGLKNPWGTGLDDVFELRPAIAIPQVADLFRPAAWKKYMDSGIEHLGICADPLLKAAAPAGCFFCARIVIPGEGPLLTVARSVRRLLSSNDNAFLIFDLTFVADVERMRQAMDGIIGPILAPDAGLSHFPPPESRLAAHSPPPAGIAADWRPCTPPMLHAKIEATAAIARKKRKKNEEYQDLLLRLTAGGPLPPPSADGAWDASRQLRLVAHMLGEVALAGSDFDVRILGGRFCGATQRGKDLLPRRPATSYIKTGGRTSYYRTMSSFSFEDESGTGLREELKLDGQDKPGMSIEYSFCTDSPLLSLDAKISYPMLPAAAEVTEYAPLAISLREVARGESAIIEVTAPDESTACVTLTEESGAVGLPGAIYRVKRADGGWIVLRFGTVDTKRWGFAFFRVVKVRGVRILEANPFGSYTPMPGAGLSGQRESFTLLLGLEGA
jgi:hypothetical protein